MQFFTLTLFIQFISLQKKTLRIIMRIRDCHSSSLFKRHKDKIQVENVLLVSKYCNDILPSIFDNWFTLSSDIQNYDRAVISRSKLFKPLFQTNLYWKNSIAISAINAWNKMQTVFGDVILKNFKVGLSRFQFVFYFHQLTSFENYEKCLLLHLNSSFCSHDIQMFVLTFWSCRKTA